MARSMEELAGSATGGSRSGSDAARLAEVEELLRSVIGLEPSSVGVGWARLRVRERLEATAVADLGAYLELLRSDRAEVQALAERMVVPETWFFRDKLPFLNLARFVVGTWAPAHPSRRLRVLSLPCASGEEPYSVVMALLDAGFPGERLRVDGVDLRQEALDRAEHGVYGAHSFRGANGGYRTRYFTETDDGAAVAPEVRQPVRFTRANVLEEGLAERLTPYDVVLCRNLMVYLDHAARTTLRRVVAQLTLPGGLLIAGRAEPSSAWEPDFTALPPVSSCAYRRVVQAAPRVPPPAARPEPSVVAPRTPRALTDGLPKPGSRKQPRETVSTGVQGGLERAQELADQGDLAQAERECSRILSEQGPSPAVFVLLAALASARGEVDRAEPYLVRALYLDPHNVEALALLAVDRRRRGDLEGERRLRDRLRRVTSSAVEHGP